MPVLLFVLVRIDHFESIFQRMNFDTNYQGAVDLMRRHKRVLNDLEKYLFIINKQNYIFFKKALEMSHSKMMILNKFYKDHDCTSQTIAQYQQELIMKAQQCLGIIIFQLQLFCKILLSISF